MRPSISTRIGTPIFLSQGNHARLVSHQRQRQRLFRELSSLHEIRRQRASSVNTRPTNVSSMAPMHALHTPHQTRSMSIWSWFGFGKEEENDSSSGNTVRMPPRQRGTKNDQQRQSKYNNNNTAIEKKDREVQRIIDTPVGEIDDTVWSDLQKPEGGLLKRLLAQENIGGAFRLLGRLSREPNAGTKLTQPMVYSVVKQWSILYSRQQRKPSYNTSSSSSSGENNNAPRLNNPYIVWKKIKSYEARGVKLSSITYHRLIDATVHLDKKPQNIDQASGPFLADEILAKMMDLSEQSRTSRIRASRYTFNAVLSSWEAAAAHMNPRSGSYRKAADRSLELLNQAKTLYHAGWEDAMPNRETYMKVMRFFAQQGNGDKVEELMEEMYSMYLDNGQHPSLSPSNNFFSLVLFAWSRSKDPAAADRAVELFDHMLELEANQEIPGLEVTPDIYNIVFVCLSRQATEETLNRMQALFDRMVELAKTDPTKKPTSSSYHALTIGWSKVDPARAEQVIWTWKQEAKKGNCTQPMVDGKIVTALLTGWYNSVSPDSAEMCDRLLQSALEEGKDVTATNFNMTINAWCRRKSIDAIDRGESLLRQMQELNEKRRNKRSLKPTIYSFSPLIFAYASTGYAERAEALLRELFEGFPIKERGQSSSSKKNRLDTNLVNGVLTAWLEKATKDSQAVDRCESLLLDMPTLGVRPNLGSFDIVLDCKERQKNSSLGTQTTTTKNARSNEIIALLDKEYKNGSLGCKLENYLTKRQAWVLFNA